MESMIGIVLFSFYYIFLPYLLINCLLVNINYTFSCHCSSTALLLSEGFSKPL